MTSITGFFVYGLQEPIEGGTPLRSHQSGHPMEFRRPFIEGSWILDVRCRLNIVTLHLSTYFPLSSTAFDSSTVTLLMVFAKSLQYLSPIKFRSTREKDHEWLIELHA